MAGGYAIARRTPKNMRTVLERNLIGLESSDLPSNIAFISANTTHLLHLFCNNIPYKQKGVESGEGSWWWGGLSWVGDPWGTLGKRVGFRGR